MGKNMNLFPSLLLHKKHKQLWSLWPSCTHSKTTSFRATKDHEPIFKNPKNDMLVEPQVEFTTLGSFFTNSSESASTSTESDECSAVETIVRGARSDRLFFEPDATSSILETHGSGRKCTTLVCKESVTIVMESHNPYQDFKKSMEEMVEMHGLKDWECLEELLRWYLRMNGKNNHEFIVGAFVDLLAGINGGHSFTSVASTFSSSTDHLSHEGKMVIK
ncbi:Ovate protein family, C-terminal [Artemisia annua]|uniref:Transcription repressor n=1 Tax=Artemisia annua TaxID=35608 RepID=A0A2U1M003_ARTAN|nr:Ovate protein family, C-terminal [Artemisia annua]